jgi:hypothetical protein
MNPNTGEIHEITDEMPLLADEVAITAEEAEVLAAEPPGPGRFTMLHQIRGKDRSGAHQAPMSPRAKRRRDRAARKARR